MQWIRKHTVTVASIAIACFVIWLVAEVLTLRTTRAQAAGTINGKKVSSASFQRALEAAAHQAVLMYGDQFRQQVSPQQLEREAWERLLLLSEARRRRIKVSDREVIENIMKQPLFQNQGRFDEQGYRAVVQYSLGTTPRIYEEETRENLMIGKLYEAVTQDVRVEPADIEKHFLRKGAEIRVTYLQLTEEPLAREIAESARQDPGRLPDAARQLGKQLKTTTFFKQETTLPEIGSAELVFNEMFDKENGEVAGPLFTFGTAEARAIGWLVARLDDKRLPDIQQIEKDRGALEKEVLGQKRYDFYMDWFQDLTEKAKIQKNRGPSRLPAAP